MASPTPKTCKRRHSYLRYQLCFKRRTVEHTLLLQIQNGKSVWNFQESLIMEIEWNLPSCKFLCTFAITKKNFISLIPNGLIFHFFEISTLDDLPEIILADNTCKNLTRPELSCKSRNVLQISWKNLASKRLIYLTDISCKKNEQIRNFLQESCKIL